MEKKYFSSYLMLKLTDLSNLGHDPSSPILTLKVPSSTFSLIFTGVRHSLVWLAFPLWWSRRATER